jgi:predicted homoserine dehydrogenase-like protein
VAELITCAKHDLKAGEVLDGGGGRTVYALIERAGTAKSGLTESVKKGEVIRWSQVQISQDSFLLRLYQMQQATFA